MKLLYKTQPPLQDVQLIAWHHMLNDPMLSTYTFDNGREQRTWVNPKLAYRRSLILMSEAMSKMVSTIQEALFGPFVDFSKALENLGNTITGMLPGIEGMFDGET